MEELLRNQLPDARVRGVAPRGVVAEARDVARRREALDGVDPARDPAEDAESAELLRPHVAAQRRRAGRRDADRHAEAVAAAPQSVTRRSVVACSCALSAMHTAHCTAEARYDGHGDAALKLTHTRSAWKWSTTPRPRPLSASPRTCASTPARNSCCAAAMSDTSAPSAAERNPRAFTAASVTPRRRSGCRSSTGGGAAALCVVRGPPGSPRSCAAGDEAGDCRL